MTRLIPAAVLAVGVALCGAAHAANPPASTPPGTAQSVTDTLLSSGTAKLQNVLWWNEANQASVAASSTTSYTSRSSGTTQGSPGPFGYFTVVASTAVAGTLYAQCGNIIQNAATTANLQSSTTIKMPAFAASCFAAFVNGTTAGTVTISDGFTAY